MSVTSRVYQGTKNADVFEGETKVRCKRERNNKQESGGGIEILEPRGAGARCHLVGELLWKGRNWWHCWQLPMGCEAAVRWHLPQTGRLGMMTSEESH